MQEEHERHPDQELEDGCGEVEGTQDVALVVLEHLGHAAQEDVHHVGEQHAEHGERAAGVQEGEPVYAGLVRHLSVPPRCRPARAT